MKIYVGGAIVALIFGLSAQVSHAEIVAVAADSQPDGTAVRIDTLERQIAALQAQLATTCGTERPVGEYKSECGSFYTGVELAVLQPHVGSLSASVLSSPYAQITPEFDYITSPRVWVGYENAEGLGVRGTFWTFDNSATQNVVPGILAIENRVAARTLDFETTQRAQLGHLELQFAGGTRYAKSRFSLGADLVPFGAGEIDARFEGIGPTLALDVRRPFGCRGFAFFGGVRNSWLFGDTIADVNVNDTTLASLKASDHMMQVSEGRVGVEWSRCLASGSEIFARAAYEAQSWQWAPVAMLVKQDIGFVGPSFALGFSR